MIRALWPSAMLSFAAAGGITLDANVGVALVSSAGAVVVGYLGLRQRHQDREVSDVHLLVDQLQEERTAARTRLDSLESRQRVIEGELEAYKLGTARLVRQIVQLGHEPSWRPPMTPN